MGHGVSGDSGSHGEIVDSVDHGGSGDSGSHGGSGDSGSHGGSTFEPAAPARGPSPRLGHSAGSLLPPPKNVLGKLGALSSWYVGGVGSWGRSGCTQSWGRSGSADTRGRSVSSWNGASSGVDSVSSWTGAGSGVDSVLAADGCGLAFPADGEGRRAADDGGLILAWGRTFSRHRRIPSLHLSPVVSGRSMGRWELAPCQNIESRGEPAELPGILNEWEILAVKGNEAGGDFHSSGEKTGTTKNFSKAENKTWGKSTAHFLFFRLAVLSQCRWSK